jgi:hypothetical protein
MKVRVFYNTMNEIVAIVELKEEKGHHLVVLPKQNIQYSDIELSDEQSKMSLLDLHVKHAIELKEGKARLIPLKMTKPAR